MLAALVINGGATTTSSAASSTWKPYQETVDKLLERLCRKGGTTVDLGACTSEAYTLADKELNRIYKVVLTSLAPLSNGKPDLAAPDSTEIKALRASQKAWIKFRDAERTLIEAGFEGGSAAAEQGIRRAIALTINRIDDLQMLAAYDLAGELTASDFAGTWIDPNDPDHWYRFAPVSDTEAGYKCKGPTGERSGKAVLKGTSWAFSAKTCSGPGDEESMLIGWLDGGALHRLRMVHDGPRVTARLVRR